MALSQKEVQSLVDRLNNRERSARRLALISSILIFVIGGLILAFLTWRLNMARYDLTAHNQEIWDLKNKLALAQSQNQVNQQDFLSEKQKFQLQIKDLENNLIKCQASGNSRFDELQQTVMASNKKIGELTQALTDTRATAQDAKNSLRWLIPRLNEPFHFPPNEQTSKALDRLFKYYNACLENQVPSKAELTGFDLFYIADFLITSRKSIENSEAHLINVREKLDKLLGPHHSGF